MKLALIPTLILTLADGSADRCVPTGVVRIETVDASPDLPQGSFARKPKVLYRSGRLYARIEEAADSENGIHGLIVVSAPDSWMVNLADNSGQHVIDKDPEPGVRAPVFPPQSQPADFPKEFLDLDLGCELAFFGRLHAEQSPHQVGAVALTKHVLTRGIWRLTLVTGPTDGTPQALLLSKAGKVSFVLKYVSYTQRSDVDPSLFQKPTGIRFEDQ